MRVAATVYLEQVLDRLKLLKARLPRDPVTAGWYVRGFAEMLDAVLYDLGLSTLAATLLDAAHEAREKGDIDVLIDELERVTREIEALLRRTRGERAAILAQLADRLSGVFESG